MAAVRSHPAEMGQRNVFTSEQCQTAAAAFQHQVCCAYLEMPLPLNSIAACLEEAHQDPLVARAQGPAAEYIPFRGRHWLQTTFPPYVATKYNVVINHLQSGVIEVKLVFK